MSLTTDAARIRQTVFDLTHFQYDGEIDVCEGPGLRVSCAAGRAKIAAESKTALARGYFLLAQALSGGQTSVEIDERKQFDTCGCFLDFSRGGVMTVAACKRWIDYSAALGLNLLILYTEDTYTVPEYPYLGYLRGRYTKEELREIDDYADSMGIELVPCIQTLAHLGQFLQWSKNEHLRDQATCLLIDEPETYDFIEAEIRAVRDCVRTKRLHIGMDEAHGVGLGRYFEKHGLTDRFDLLGRHLSKVVALCEKYDFHPIMWSDMFFRLGSKTGEYYDLEASIPQKAIDELPPVDLCYWDYYHTDTKWYEHMLTQHEKMNANTVFAGGIWTWSGFLPQVELTWNTMMPGLKTCAEHKVRTVVATMWGDDGNETNMFLAMSQVPLFSEFFWRGEGATREEIEAVGEYLTGLPREAYEAFSLFYPGDKDIRTGKGLIYCDLLYPMLEGWEKMDDCIPRYERARDLLKPHLDNQECAFADLLFDICLRKAAILRDVRREYLAGNGEYLKNLADTEIPALISRYEALTDSHRSLWERDYKRNGWEVLALRYGAVVGRLRDVQCALNRYLAGELDTLCELDEQPLNARRKYGMQFYSVYPTPAFSL